MSKYTSVMVCGIAMATIMGTLMVLWLALNEGSGFVGLLFIAGMLVGMAVFAGGAAEAVRSTDRRTDTRGVLFPPPASSRLPASNH